MSRNRKPQSVTLATVRALSSIPTETLSQANDPTAERLQRAGVTVAMQLGTRALQVINPPKGLRGFDGVIRVNQAPLDRLAARDQLDPSSPERNDHLFQVGDKLRDHHHLAGLSGFAANDLLGSSGGGHPSSRTPITETMEKHRRAVRFAESAMDKGDWSAVSAIVIEERTLEDVGRALGFGERHAAAAVALDRLRRGLGVLADLWGYLPPQRQEPSPQEAANDPVSGHGQDNAPVPEAVVAAA